MGFVNRKKSGNIIGGSRLIVDGQNIFNVVINSPNFNKGKSSQDSVSYFEPTPTPTPTPTVTPTPSITPTFGLSPTPSNTPTKTLTPTPTGTEIPVETPTPTNTETPTPTPTQTPTNTETPTPTPTQTPTNTETPTPTPTNTPTPTGTEIPVETPTPTPTTTQTPTMTPVSPTASVCVSGAGSELNGTYTYSQTVTVNGFTRPTYEFGLFLITPTSVTGTTYWSIYNSDDEGNYYLGNTTPPPQYPYQETSWTLAALGVLPLPTVNVFACPTPTPTPTNTQTPPSITTLTLEDCAPDSYTAYTTSIAFAVGITIYQDNGLTIPYDSILLGTNIYSPYKYNIVNGLVTNTPTICD